MRWFPSDYASAAYDPVFWAQAMTIALGIWAIGLNQVQPALSLFELLLCCVLAGWLCALRQVRLERQTN